MRIFIICSKAFYSYIPKIKEELESCGHIITLPNCYDSPETESKYRGSEEHGNWKAEMIRHSESVISSVDSVLVLNYSKNGMDNYIGGATFLEMYDAFRLGKIIYLMNGMPEGLLKDEIIGFKPIIINGDLSKISVKAEIKYNKLVRDKIPDIIMAKGETPEVSILDDEAYKKELDIKIQEELREYLADDSVEELADLVEVVYGILDYKNISLDEFESIRIKKNDERGAFKKRLFLKGVKK